MPQRQIHYADDSFDRAAERREDQDWLRARLADPATRIVPMADGKHAISRESGVRPAYLSPDDIPGVADIEPLLLLGVRDDVAYFAAALDADRIGDGAEPLPLRDVVADLSQADAAILAYAGAMMHWHRGHRFCGACGGPTRVERCGHMRRCENPDCRRTHFPRTDPAVITLVIDGEQCLLARRRVWPENRRSTIAGFVEPGETLEHAVRREILEEVGVTVGEVRYRGSQPWPFPTSFMLGFWAIAESREITVDGEEISEADWYTRAEITDAVAAGTLILPPFDSISHRLVADWREAQA